MSHSRRQRHDEEITQSPAMHPDLGSAPLHFSNPVNSSLELLPELTTSRAAAADGRPSNHPATITRPAPGGTPRNSPFTHAEQVLLATDLSGPSQAPSNSYSRRNGQPQSPRLNADAEIGPSRSAPRSGIRHQFAIPRAGVAGYPSSSAISASPPPPVTSRPTLRKPAVPPTRSHISPTSPIHVSAMAEGKGHRMVPRTSSIDSAISSLSAASQSNKASLDPNNVTPTDIANLISTAGSPEAVIIHLLKEKQHAASQNDQLWKVLDKQRTMLHALNKDLERAMKEKEKYRKRLKDMQNAPPPLPTDGRHHATPIDHHHGSSREENLRRTSEIDDLHHATDPSEELQSSPASTLQSAAQSAQTSTDPNEDTFPQIVHSPESQTSIEAAGHSIATVPQNSRPSHIENPTLNSSPKEINPEYSPSLTKSARSSLPTRKPPPAPLKLDEAQKVKPDIILDDRKNNSESEYDEILEDNEIPNVERGRRKTREEDDRLREVAMIKEQEFRSRSNKKKVKHFDPPESLQKEQAQAFLNVGLPASPRSGMMPSPMLAAAQSPPPASLSAILQPGASDSSGSNRSRLASPLSPGLPQSPRPGDRPVGSPTPRYPNSSSVISPPLSPRTIIQGQFQTMPNSSTAQPTGEDVADQPGAHSAKHEDVDEAPNDDVPTYKLMVEEGSPVTRNIPHLIYRGMVSPDYPDLLLPPNALPTIDIKVSSSRLRPSRSSYMALKPIEEEPVFTLSVYSCANRTELWRVEKSIITLPQLDQQIKQLSNFSTKLPERSIFSGHSPAKVDARRAALNSYFESLLTHPMDETAALVLCQFLTADAIEPRDDESNLLHGPGNGGPPISFGPDGKPRMEGYLTKKGKNFGGWKSRYFVLNGPELKYYESPGGPHLGTIKIPNAQIGKQSSSGKNQSPSRADDDSDNQYRHAFLILEPKRRDSSALVRHVLCAESDEERDSWVKALLCYVETRDNTDEQQAQGSKSNTGTARRMQAAPSKKPGLEPQLGTSDTLRALSYDDVVAAEAPVRGPGGGKITPPTTSMLDTSVRHHEHDNSSPTSKIISGPTNAMKIQDAGAWGNRTVTSTKEKKRSIWGFRAPITPDLANQGLRQESAASVHDVFLDHRAPIRPVFGLPLADAVEFCGPHGIDCGLPAVVYRCLEYLRAQNTEMEEGIFRLSGSNVVIKALKERFNTEGDVDFLNCDHYYDVHAVASLFKQYLRELPTTVLTKELHLDFIHVLELDDKRKKIVAFHSLVHRLPRPNFDLLCALSQFLIVIVNNADVNKMTVRNVGIVFAPTLNMPAPVFSMFLTEFDAIFGDRMPFDQSSGPGPAELMVNNRRLNPEDIRSPRRQMFSDLPTPAYDQNSFEDHRVEASEDFKRRIHTTGFVPIHPNYEPPPIPQQQNEELNLSQLRSMNGLLTPGAHISKSKRRESTLLFMDNGK